MTHTETHSPLPWVLATDEELGGLHHAVRRSDNKYGAAYNNTIAELHQWTNDKFGQDRDEALANAKLIVRSVNALPSLVEALENFLGNPNFHVWVGGNPIAVDEMLAKARAALALAKGE